MKFNELNQVAEMYGISGGGNDEGWLSLKEGDNRVRIVSEYEPLAKHWSAKKGTICIGKDKGCVFCSSEDSEKPSVKFLMWVIDRTDGKLRIGEFGWSIVNTLREFQEDPEYHFENLPPFDVNIRKTVKNGGKQPSDTEYSVIASRTNTELSPEEIEAVGKLNTIKSIVDTMKAKTLKEYQGMGLIQPTADAPSEPSGNEAPSFLQPNT